MHILISSLKEVVPKLEVGMIPYLMIGDPLVQVKNLLRNAQYLVVEKSWGANGMYILEILHQWHYEVSTPNWTLWEMSYH